MSEIPHNREAEEATVGAVLIAPEMYPLLTAIVKSEEFYIHRLRFIWEAFNRLHEHRTPIDFLTVTEELDKAGQLSEVGGPAYITALLNQVPTSLHAEAYGRMVHALFVRRALITAANKVADGAYNLSLDIETVAGDSMAAVQKAANGLTTRSVTSVSAAASSYYDRVIENSRKDDSELGLLTGFPDLDRQFGWGMKPKTYMMAGRPGSGKSALWTNIARNVAQSGRSVLHVSLEMRADEIINRLVGIETGIDTSRIEGGRLAGDEWQSFTDAMQTFENWDYHIEDAARQSLQSVRAKCFALRPDFLLIDYLLLLQGHESRPKEHERVNALARDVKIMQQELGIPVAVLHQQNRGAAMRVDKKPTQEDLREGGEMDADWVGFIWQPDDDPHGRKIIPVKHRSGALYEIPLYFHPECQRFDAGTVVNFNGGK